MEYILQLQGVTKNFGGLAAVSNLSFEVKPQEIFGFIGPNGAGKTTVFNLIMGVFTPDSGKIVFKNNDITGWKTYKIVNEGLARTFQLSRPFHKLTVRENIQVAAASNDVFTSFSKKNSDSKSAKTVEAIAALVGLKDKLKERPDALPQGDLRRLEMAKALATQPKLILLDEPFAGLSISEIEEISEFIQLLSSEGYSLVIIDHNMKGLMKLVQRVLVISFGEKLAEGIPQDIVANEKVQTAYLAGG